MGPMSGRAAGYCAGYGVPGFMNPAYGRGGMGNGAWGRGRGHRNWYYATGLTGWQRAAMGWPGGRAAGPSAYAGGYGSQPAVPVPPYAPAYPPPYGGFSPEQELEMLRDQVEGMEEGLKAAQERIAELESEAGGAGEGS